MDFTVRQLKKKDQKVLTKMLFDLIDEIDDQSIQDIIKSSNNAAAGDGPALSDEEQRAQTIRVFMQIFKKLAANLEDKLNAFFADLIGDTPELYAERPFDIDIQIIDELNKRPEISNFFTGALRLFNATAWFDKASLKLKEKFDSASDSM